jgi:hypothetical protein
LWATQLDHIFALPSAIIDEYGHLYSFDAAAMKFKCYDVRNGNLLWTSDVAGVYPWGSDIVGSIRAAAYGMVYTGSYDGNVRALDANTGEIKWTYYVGDTNETIYGTWPAYGVAPVADGKVFVRTGEHTPTQPRFRFNKLFCLDAYTGRQIWNISGALGPMALADGYLLASSESTGLEYCFGKGQTATTVTVQNDIIPKGSAIMIKGTVMDQSPAQPDTPAISDEDMTAWMNYLQMQEPLSTTVTGVPVTLTAIDPNGNTQNIDTVTSDASGMFSCLWTPPIEGKYTIIATFNGTESYWSSSAETAIGVSAALAPTATPTPTPTATPTATPTPAPTVTPSPVPEPKGFPTTELYIAIAAAAIIIAVAAVAVFLRRRK